MPLYDYVCASCGERTEVMHAVHASGPTACHACGGPMRKALSAPAIVFKGSGWAKKDARSAPAGSGEGEARKAGSSSAEGGADSAPKSDTTAKKEASAAAD